MSYIEIKLLLRYCSCSSLRDGPISLLCSPADSRSFSPPLGGHRRGVIPTQNGKSPGYCAQTFTLMSPYTIHRSGQVLTLKKAFSSPDNVGLLYTSRGPVFCFRFLRIPPRDDTLALAKLIPPVGLIGLPLQSVAPCVAHLKKSCPVPDSFIRECSYSSYLSTHFLL